MVQNTDGQLRPIQAIIGCNMLIMNDLEIHSNPTPATTLKALNPNGLRLFDFHGNGQ
jgi:hypothetical protein